ncbi:MAG: hypothetical protein KJ583_07110 [Nanoarchaeota archaeon]|nr:hypothetical protein [Nanoarchaeota archaeon]MBU1269597.1 hypothetical protein [Nanoarchaeota archaeon]MBU1605055.1 hypothetical protein [Nanoarchaeota archaeon]MBU2442609.1 hypothetical protein [Nanoarchaeota archaeon]
MKFIFLNEGFRMFRRKLQVSKNGFRRYSGDANHVCRAIVNDCYNHEKNYFMASTGHFSEFWSRDFGLCVRSLKYLGYQKEIENTLKYALGKFCKNKSITTTISPVGKPFNFPTYAPDSLAFIVHSLVIANNKEINVEYKDFIENEAKKFFEIVVDKDSGLVKKSHFSSMKDHAVRKSSCYDNVMVGWLSKNLKTLGFENPLSDYNFKKIIKDNFWTGSYFLDDLSGRKFITGDSNVFPFWTGVFNSRNMINSAVKSVRKEGLDKPFPLKYSMKKSRVIWYGFFAKGYEFQNIWPMMSYPYIELVSSIDKELARVYLKRYSEVIEKNETFLEVYTPSGKPFKTLFYMTDEGMLWSAMHLRLSRNLLKN